MKAVYLSKKNNGIGLIEVLITTVVIAVGLLAVASMQGDFMSVSATNKTRAEALALAERKIEELKNNIVIADYTAIAGSPAAESIGGVNATFSRTWAVTPLTPPTRKNIAVTVTWGAASDQQVLLTSEIAFSDPGNSAGIADFVASSTGKSPSPNQDSSETVNDTVELRNPDGSVKDGFTPVPGSTNLYEKDGNLYRDDGNNTGTGTLVFYCDDIVGAADFDVDLRNPLNYETTGELKTTGLINLLTKRLDLDGVGGAEAIELYTRNYIADADGVLTADGSCTREHRYFGGAIVSIKGTVHTINNLDDIKVDFNKSDMFCVFDPGTGQTERPYACYAGANCNVSPAGDNNNVNTCPDPSSADAKVGPGGFSGNVGLLNVDDDGAGKESVCFKEELDNGPIASPQVAIIAPATARKYKTNNNNAEQGINRSYACQDFYIVDRQANFDKLSAKCAGEVGTLNLPPKEVVRLINGANVVGNTTSDLENSSYCSPRAATTYTLTITLPGGDYTVTTLGGTCTPTPASTTATCTVTTSGTSVEVFASSALGATGSCIIDELVSTTTDRSCSITVQVPPTYTITGPLTQPNGSPDFVVRAYDSYGNILRDSCDITSDSYTCEVSTNDSVVALKTINTGSGANNGKVIDNCTQTITVGTDTYNPSCSLTSKK